MDENRKNDNGSGNNSDDDNKPVTPRNAQDIFDANLLAALNIHAQRASSRAAARQARAAEREAQQAAGIRIPSAVNLADRFRLADNLNEDGDNLDENLNLGGIKFEKQLLFSLPKNALIKNPNCKPVDNLNPLKDDFDEHDKDKSNDGILRVCPVFSSS